MGSDEALQRGIVRAMNLVERFLGAHVEGDVEVLKRQVHAAIAASTRGGRTKKGMGGSTMDTTNATNFTTFGTTSRDGGIGKVGAQVRAVDARLSTTAPAGARRSSAKASTEATAEVDFTLPPIWIDRKARLQTNTYAKMLKAQDMREIAEDAKKKASAKLKAQEQRRFLDTQVEYQHRLRLKNRAEILDDRKAIDLDLVAFENENKIKAAKLADTIAKEKAARASQVAANRARAEAKAAEELADDRERIRQQMLEAAAAEKARKDKIAANKRELQKVQEDNVVRLRLKAEELQKAKERDQQMMRDNERLADEREKARIADIEAHKAKILAKFLAGGGDALETGMAEKAAEDERRMNEELAKQDARDREKARLKRETADRLNAECNASIEQQLANRRDLAAKEAVRKQERARAMTRDIEDLRTKEKLIKQKEEERKKKLRDEIFAQMQADATRRWKGGVDDMPVHEMKFNGMSLHA